MKLCQLPMFFLFVCFCCCFFFSSINQRSSNISFTQVFAVTVLNYAQSLTGSGSITCRVVVCSGFRPIHLIGSLLYCHPFKLSQESQPRPLALGDEHKAEFSQTPFFPPRLKLLSLFFTAFRFHRCCYSYHGSCQDFEAVGCWVSCPENLSFPLQAYIKLVLSAHLRIKDNGD